MRLSEMQDGFTYGHSGTSYLEPWSTDIVRKKGNKLYARHTYYYDRPRLIHSSAGLEIVSAEKAGFYVCLSTGEAFPVRHLGKSSCIASIESIFTALGVRARVTWKTKESFEKWSKRWSKKASTIGGW